MAAPMLAVLFSKVALTILAGLSPRETIAPPRLAAILLVNVTLVAVRFERLDKRIAPPSSAILSLNVTFCSYILDKTAVRIELSVCVALFEVKFV